PPPSNETPAPPQCICARNSSPQCSPPARSPSAAPANRTAPPSNPSAPPASPACAQNNPHDPSPAAVSRREPARGALPSKTAIESAAACCAAPSATDPENTRASPRATHPARDTESTTLPPHAPSAYSAGSAAATGLPQTPH